MEITSDNQWESHIGAFTQYLNRADITIKIQELLSTNKTRLPINLDHVKQHYPQLYPLLLSKPLNCLKIMEGTLQTIIDGLNNEGTSAKKRQQGNVMVKRPHYTFAFEGNLGKNHITPRGLNSLTIHNLVAVNGIVTRMSIVRPKLVHSVHYCDNTQVGTVKEYYDQFNLTSDKSLQALSNAFPKKDEHDNPLTTEYGFCKYKDYQTLLVQEMPEKAPTGMMPHSIEVVLEEDLVDKVKPGDRIQVTGVYKAITNQNSNQNAIFRGVLIATNLHIISSDVDNPNITPEDIRNIRKLAEKQNLLEILAKSIAPSIYGHHNIKKAILLMLLGGIEKVLENKTHLRGDINILMIGDPSTAKSQLLRRVLTIAPLAVNTTGRGSSGVGLTAAVTFDKDTGDKHLEAGAMVLADRGIVCIDEFDKMEESDRVAIHEVMEQQTVTIAKAGIHTTLNARCSVVAAANPIYGEYQKDLPPTKNIGLPDSLLSRFDFIFIVLDEKNSEIDRLIAERVTKNHRYITPGHEDNLVFYDQDDDFIIEPEILEQNSNEVYEKYNATIHDSEGELLTQRFLKKYIFYAKKTVIPQLKDEAVDFISNAWTQMRQREHEEGNLTGPKTMSITRRTLESLIRVATAHAKMRLSKEVTIRDCEIALELLNFALFNERDADKDSDWNDNNEDEDDFKPSGGRKSDIMSEMRETRSKKQGQDSLLKPKQSEKESKMEDLIEDKKRVDTKLLKRKVEAATQKKEEKAGKKDSSQEKELTKKMTKMALKDQDDVDELLDKAIASEIEVSEEAIKYVFREFNKIRGHRSQIPEAELWDHITNNITSQESKIAESLKRKEGMKKALEILDEKNKLMINKGNKTVISLD